MYMSTYLPVYLSIIPVCLLSVYLYVCLSTSLLSIYNTCLFAPWSRAGRRGRSVSTTSDDAVWTISVKMALPRFHSQLRGAASCVSARRPVAGGWVSDCFMGLMVPPHLSVVWHWQTMKTNRGFRAGPSAALAALSLSWFLIDFYCCFHVV